VQLLLGDVPEELPVSLIHHWQQVHTVTVHHFERAHHRVAGIEGDVLPCIDLGLHGAARHRDLQEGSCPAFLGP
jgi:hypothetical protein